VAAAVPKTSLMTNQDSVRAEGVAVQAARRRVDDPLPARGLN
jgi:hypothetical protein